MRNCQELADLHELYALGALDSEERTELEEHLARGCPNCSGGIRRALASTIFLATLPEPVDVPPRLRRRILASVRTPESNWAGVAAWVAVTAALLIAVVWLTQENRQRGIQLEQARSEIRRSASDLSRAQAALQFLNEPDTRQVVFGQGQPQPLHGRFLMNPRRGVLLMIANLPPAPAGKIYEMWLIPKNGTPQPAGLFQTDAQGNALYLHEGALDITATGAAAVSIEPQTGSSAPTTTPIIVATIASR